MSALSPLSRLKQKLDFGAVRSVFGPTTDITVAATARIGTSWLSSDNIGFCSYSRPSYPVRQYRLAETRHTIPDRDCPYRHPTELIFCDQLTYVGVLSEIFGTFLAIRSATNRDKAGPTIRTSIKRAICCAITNPTSTLVDAAIMATESAPPGLVAR